MTEMNILEKFEFKFLSFELDPSAPKIRKLNIIENFAKKYHISIEEAKIRVEHINKLGRDEGIDFKYDTAKGGNTLTAHRLAKYIANKGDYENTKKIINLLYDAYFTKNLLISDEKALIDLGMEVGCTKKELEKLIEGDEYTKEVRDDEERAYAEGVHAVPYFKINGEVIKWMCFKRRNEKSFVKSFKYY